MSSFDQKTKSLLLKRAENLYNINTKHGETRKAKAFLHAFKQLHDKDNVAYLHALSRMKRFPVTVEEFVKSNDFLGEQVSVWPTVLNDIVEINTDQICGEEHVYEALLAGAIGIGKSMIGEITTLYQLYVLSCFHEPQKLFGLPTSTRITFLLQSIKPRTAIITLYKPLREKFEAMPFAKKFLSWNKNITSELRLEDNLIVAPSSANINSMIGQAIVGGVIDEINFFARVEKSTQTPDGSVFDNAEIVYKGMTRRRSSRFTTQGISPGVIVASSSTKYKGDFTDRRSQEILSRNEPNVKLFRHAQFDVVPAERFSGEKFVVLYGTELYPTTVVKNDDHLKELKTKYLSGEFREIPIEYKPDFLKDPEGALRDICGVSSGAISPFITQRHKVKQAQDLWVSLEKKRWFEKDVYVLRDGDGYPEPILQNLPVGNGNRYFAHIDLSLVKDRVGIAIVSVSGEKLVNGVVYPVIDVDAVVGIEPDPSHHIDLSEVRRVIITLKKAGINIASCTFDGFNSADSMQLLRKIGIVSTLLSVDKTTDPYVTLKNCFYEDRISLQPHELCYEELIKLEYDATANNGKGKVDHIAVFSKDMADAVCGAVFAASGPKSGLTARVEGYNKRAGSSRVSSNRR